MKKLNFFATLLSLVVVCGCSSVATRIQQVGEGVSDSIVSARPIDISIVKDFIAKNPDVITSGVIDDANRKKRNELIANLMLDSVQKCQEFRGRLSLTQRGSDASFDIMTTILTSLGAAFVPAQTVRALSASAAITNGTKGALSADLFAQKASWVIDEQIKIDYVQKFDKLTEKFNATIIDWPLSAAASDIILWHSSCSVDSALASMHTASAQFNMGIAMIEHIENINKLKSRINGESGNSKSPNGLNNPSR